MRVAFLIPLVSMLASESQAAQSAADREPQAVAERFIDGQLSDAAFRQRRCVAQGFGDCPGGVEIVRGYRLGEAARTRDTVRYTVAFQVIGVVGVSEAAPFFMPGSLVDSGEVLVVRRAGQWRLHPARGSSDERVRTTADVARRYFDLDEADRSLLDMLGKPVGVSPVGDQSSYMLDQPRLIATGDSMFVQIGRFGRRWHMSVTPSNVQYKSKDPSILTIRPNGLVIAHRPGWVVVEASWPEGRLRDKIYVMEPVAEVRIEPRDTVLHIGDSLLVRTVVKDSTGAELPLHLGWGFNAGPDPAAFGVLRTVHPSGVWIVAGSVGEGRIWTNLGPRVDTARVRVIK